MFGWFTAAWSALKGLGAIKGFIDMRKNKSLMDAGAAKEREMAKDDAIEKALRARRAARHTPGSVSKFDRDKDGE